MSDVAHGSLFAGGVAALGIQAKFVENLSFSRCNNINNSITRVVSRNNLIHDIIKIYAFQNDSGTHRKK